MAYKSRIRVFGLPLIHISAGEPAIGVIAIGQHAYGVFAIGQFGVGLVFGIGQFMGGLVSIGQFSVGPLCSIGMFSLGWYSIGMFSAGYEGLHLLGYHFIEKNFLETLLRNWDEVIFAVLFFLVFCVSVAIVNGVFQAVYGWIKRWIVDIYKKAKVVKGDTITKKLTAISPLVSALFFAFSLFFVGECLHYFRIDNFFDRAGYNRIMKTGATAIGEINEVVNLSISINDDQYVVLIKMTARPDDPEIRPFPCELVAVVSDSDWPSPGDHIKLKYDLKNRVDVLWLRE